MDLEQRKVIAGEEIDRIAGRVWELSMRIHQNPELGFQEIQASRWIAAELRALGFAVTLGIGGLPTAFKAYGPSTTKRPIVAIQAEYDALPDIGHGCGHNLIAGAAVAGAAGAAAGWAGLEGQVVVLGTPAEEEGGGKIELLRLGAYDDVDVALYVHPQAQDGVMAANHARGALIARFGTEGGRVDVLEAVAATLESIYLLRRHVGGDVAIYAQILQGGDVWENVPPGAATLRIVVRGRNAPEVKGAIADIRTSIELAATLARTVVEVDVGPLYLDRVPNSTLIALMAANMRALGLNVGTEGVDATSYTDSGNVSQFIPLQAGRVAVLVDESVAMHTREFAEAADSDPAREGMIAASKVLAWTALDIAARPEALDAINDDFRARTGRAPHAR